jgi:hypothetical protein
LAISIFENNVILLPYSKGKIARNAKLTVDAAFAGGEIKGSLAFFAADYINNVLPA